MDKLNRFDIESKHALACLVQAGQPPLMRPLGLPLQTPPGALPLDPGFFPSAERGVPELETEDRTLITAGT